MLNVYLTFQSTEGMILEWAGHEQLEAIPYLIFLSIFPNKIITINIKRRH